MKEYEQKIYLTATKQDFFKCLPNRTLCSNGESQISGKFSKECVTLLFCVSFVGEKLIL
jgi:hypothetical protein